MPVDAAFFANRYSCIYLQLYTKRLISGKSLLGWCQIPVSDIIGVPTAGSVRHLSYRLRARDGTRDQGIVNISVRLESDQGIVQGTPLANCQTVVGIPLMSLPRNQAWR